QNGEVRVGLGGVADQAVELGHRRREAAVIVEDRARTVDVEGRAVLRGQGFEVDALAMQRAVLIMEGMHGAPKIRGKWRRARGRCRRFTPSRRFPPSSGP